MQFLLLVLSSFFFLFSEKSYGLTVLKDVDVSSENQIKLIFDSNISKEDIRLDAFQQIIQLSIENASVYPAKIKALKGDWSKLFVYQYSPSLVRVRLTVGGNAEDLVRGFKFDTVGKNIIARFDLKAAAEKKVGPQRDSRILRATDLSDEEGNKVSENFSEKEREIAERLKGSEGVAVGARSEKSNEANRSPSKKNSSKGENNTQGDLRGNLTGNLAGNPPQLNWKRSVLMLLIVLTLFLIGAFLVKKLGLSGKWQTGAQGNSGKGNHPRSIFSFLKKASPTLRNFKGRSGKGKSGGAADWIKPLATHVLGPQQSISVVRVGQKTLVLGVTADSIKVISQVDSDDDSAGEFSEEFSSKLSGELSGNFTHGLIEDMMPEAASDSVSQKLDFAQVIQKSNGGQYSSSPRKTAKQVQPTKNSQSAVRMRIQEKLGSMKPL